MKNDFRQMRRIGKSLDINACKEILNKCAEGFLSVIGENGYPYGVPVNYAYVENDGEIGSIYFHGAIEGQKYDAMKKCDKVSFCVIEKKDIKPSEFTTDYKSAICFGKVKEITDEKEKFDGLMKLIEVLTPNHIKEGEEYIKFTSTNGEKRINKTGMFKIEIEHLTGKSEH